MLILNSRNSILEINRNEEITMLKEVKFKPYQNALPDPEAIRFFQSFIDKEYEITLASVCSEIDAKGFMKRVEELERFYSEGLKSGILRFRQPNDPDFEEQKNTILINACRTCFIIRSYKHKEYGMVYRFYTGTDRIKGKVYFNSYYIAKLEAGYRIISVFLINERHTGWERRQGANLMREGLVFTGVWRIVEPNNPMDIEDFKSEGGLDNKGQGFVKSEEETKADAVIEQEDCKIIDNRKENIPSSNPMENVRANAILARILPLLGGRFYSYGFIRNEKSLRINEITDKKLIKAVEFATHLCEILNEQGCSALSSEGDCIYLPFVYSGEILLDGLPDFAAKDDVPDGAKVIYDTVEERRICFWYDELEEDIIENFELGEEEPAYKAYVKVDTLMRENLTDLVEFQIEKGTEFPYVIGGTFAPRIFAGVVTAVVRT
jgi:hypothetical protein